MLLIDKPSGPTSHDVVSEIRRILGGIKAGHLGTLDPLASGLLAVLLGRATKIAPFVEGDPKVYEGSIILGISTDSMDMEGNVTLERFYEGGSQAVHDLLASLVGETEQVPPMYSAVKYKGKPAYSYARRGENVPRRRRKVKIYRSEMTGFKKRGKRAEVDFMISCSPGFYVREYASRVGEALGCGAALSRLRRLSSGPFHIDQALTLQAVKAAWERGNLCLISPTDALDGLRRVEVSREWLKPAGNGAPLEQAMMKAVDGEAREGEVVMVVDPEGRLVGLHEVLAMRPFSSRPRRML